jgi:hypothetical protein
MRYEHTTNPKVNSIDNQPPNTKFTDLRQLNFMKLSMKQTRALDLLEDLETSEILFGGGAG